MKSKIFCFILIIIFLTLFLWNMRDGELIFVDTNIATQKLLLRELEISELDGRTKIRPVTYYPNSRPIASSGAFVDLSEGIRSQNFTSNSTIDNSTLFSADSMTKTVTGATILRMTEEPKYQEFFPDGIDTKLSHFLSLPQFKMHFQGSKYLSQEIQNDPNFKEITIAHLLNHTSGLPRFDEHIPNHKLLANEILDLPKRQRTGKFGENLGEYLYNNFGYELLGAIAVAVANQAETGNKKVNFGEIVNELVIDRVKEKIGEENAEKLKFFTSDQMTIIDGETRVADRPDLKIEFGPYYKDQQFGKIPSHFYDIASGGSYTNPESMALIAFHILSDKKEFSIFKNPKTLEIYNSRQVAIPDSSKVSGFGYESFSDKDYEHYRSHGGLGYGSNSNAFVDNKGEKVAVAMVSFENLSLPISYALIHQKRAEEVVKIDSELYKKSLELFDKYSTSDLLKMRNALEESYDNFKKVFDATASNTPSSSPRSRDGKALSDNPKMEKSPD